MKAITRIGWLDSYLSCKACGNHLMCEEHKQLLIADIQKYLTKKRDICASASATDCSCAE